MGSASLSPAPFTAGYGVETNDISDYVWTFAFIQGFKKGYIQKKDISLLWVGKEGYNEQTISFPIKWCVVWFSHFPYFGTQSMKTIIIKMIFWERFQETIEGIIQ